MLDKIKIGQIVKSKAGRDKNRYFVIKELIDKDYVTIVNGTLRKVDKPKKKKIKHLVFLNKNVQDEKGFSFTNNKLKEVLRPYNNGGEDS